MDNKKLKKLDGKRIALGQKHELQYIRTICAELALDLSHRSWRELISKRKLERLIRFSLKATKKLMETAK